MEQARVERTATVPKPVPEAWRRITSGFARWFGAGSMLEPRLGGQVTSEGRVGHVTIFEEASVIGWEWSRDGDPGWTEVVMSLDPSGEATSVTVVETLHEWEHVAFPALHSGDSLLPDLAGTAR